MPNQEMSVVERAHGEIAYLRRGLRELTKWLEEHREAIAYADELISRNAKLAEYVERLSTRVEEQEKERAQTEGLFAVSQTVNSSLDLQEVLNRAMDIIIKATRAERGFLMLINVNSGELSFQVARNMDKMSISSPGFQISRSITERVAKSGEPVLTTDAVHDDRFSAQQSVVTQNLRSILCIPLKVKEKVIGVVYVDNRMHAGQFQQSELNTLQSFANQSAIAIQNAQLFQDLQIKMNEIAGLKKFQDNIFASIASGVIAIDLKDRITSFNRAAETIFGINAKQTYGKEIRESLSPLVASDFPQLIEKVKFAGAPRASSEIQSTLPQRGPVNLNFNVSSLKDEGGFSTGVTIVVDDLTEKRRLEAVREMFRRYVAPTVVDRLPSNPDQLKLGGQRQELTILFADIRGYTTFSEMLPPEQLVDIMNQYLSIAADAILKQEGTLDKFMGDAVMAIFNTPLPQKDHALRAARAAIAMRDAVPQLHARLPENMRINYGIGIHTGEAVAGNVGSEQQMNFTVIGDAVNLAKRLQENATGGQIILSSHTYARIRDQVNATPLPPLKVKGREQVEEAWQLEAILG